MRMCMCIYFWKTWSHQVNVLLMISSTYRAASTNLPNPLLPPVSFIHPSWSVFKATSFISTELFI